MATGPVGSTSVPSRGNRENEVGVACYAGFSPTPSLPFPFHPKALACSVLFHFGATVDEHRFTPFVRSLLPAAFPELLLNRPEVLKKEECDRAVKRGGCGCPNDGSAEKA